MTTPRTPRGQRRTQPRPVDRAVVEPRRHARRVAVGNGRDGGQGHGVNGGGALSYGGVRDNFNVLGAGREAES